MTIKLTVSQDRIKPILAGHPWVYSRGLIDLPDGIESGTALGLYDQTGRFLAQGYFNSYSQIAVRLWSWREETVDEDFFRTRIRKALEWRRVMIDEAHTDSYRLINAENDLIPGLIVDRYADYLVVQFHTRGLERWRDEILAALTAVLGPRGIYERSESRSRRIENEEPKSGLVAGEVPDRIEIRENGHRFLVDVKAGQKTGFFLDQRDKRQALGALARGQRIVNCFSYTGGFSVYALAGGAQTVVNVDSSRSALDLARDNHALNGLDDGRVEYAAADAKEWLRATAPDWDIVLLDPPAFIKDRRKSEEGRRGYVGLNELGIRAVRPDGLLVTCSCSTHLPRPDFERLVVEAGLRAGRRLTLIGALEHGVDHPVLAAFPEGRYLKALIYRVD